MKRFFTLLLMSLACLALLASPADARRLGGGGSIGKQRTISPQQMQRAPAATGVPAQAGGNRGLGLLGGLAVGAGLGALFASMGMSEDAGGFLMVLLGIMLVVFLVFMFRRRQAPAMSYAGGGGYYRQPMQPAFGGMQTRRIPADFPVDAFLRNAKASFIGLQTANDRMDLDEIRGYTTPEMFGEIAAQIRGRGNVAQRTNVLSLHADLLEVVNEGDDAIASVRLRGQIRENNSPAEHFDEIWHVQKNLRDERAVWLLCGIQQAA